MVPKGELPVVPVPIRIGVVGHRALPDPALVVAATERILGELSAQVGSTPHLFEIVSALAAGADRVVAETVLNWPSAPGAAHRLVALLPLAKDDYIQDFDEASRPVFERLLGRASEVQLAADGKTRPAAYQRCAEEVVDRCEILIAVWDGQAARGTGGTAETVAYARRVERPLFWIHSETGEIQREDPGGRARESLRYLDEYYKEIVPGFQGEVKGELSVLAGKAEACGLGDAALEPMCELLLPHYVRADRLALKYQRRHMRAGLAVYWLAALVAATVSVLTVVEIHASWFWLEVVELLTIILLLAAAHRGDWHRKWIDYRFLAERLRAELFLITAGIRARRPEAPAYFRLSHRSDSWAIALYNAISAENGRRCQHADPPFDALKAFLATAWLGDQVAFYRRASVRNQIKQHRLTHWGDGLLYGTLVVAGVHAFGAGESLHFWLPLPKWLSMAALIIPATAAAMAGIRVHREYYRNAEKYAQLAGNLEMVQARVRQSSDRPELVREIEGANHLMLRENQDWRVVFLLQELRG